MIDIETSSSRAPRGTRKIDLKAALEHQVQAHQVAADLLFCELCRAYSSTHYDGSDLQLRALLEAIAQARVRI